MSDAKTPEQVQADGERLRNAVMVFILCAGGEVPHE